MLLHCPMCDREILTLNIIVGTAGEKYYEAMCRKCWWRKPADLVPVEEAEEDTEEKVA